MRTPALPPAPRHPRHNALSLAVAFAFSTGASLVTVGALGALSALPGNALAQALPAVLPTGGQIAAGAATISNPTANSMVVKQTTDRLAINWQSFNIGAGNSVRFDQPATTSIALNRVLGNSRSEIFGNLSSNGQVFLINPNGVLFGASAQVDVGGLVASTLNLTDRNFLDGKFVFSDPSNTGSVINQGSLTAKGNGNGGGYLALIGNQVSNTGSMQAHLGSVVLGAGGTAQLTLNDSKLVKFEVTQGALNALAENGGLIRANGGQVILTAGAKESLLQSTVNNTGIIEAQTVDRVAGNILLLAGMEAGTTNVGGTLDASAPAFANPTGGDGGFIETSAAKVKIADGARVTTAGSAAGSTAGNGGSGKTGTWLIDPTDFTIAAAGGDITGATLGTQLASNNITLATSVGGAGNGDMLVNDNVVWTNTNTLTLNAHRNVDFSGGGNLNGGATGSVALNAGHGGAGAIIGHASNTVVTANTLVATALTGIGTSVTPLITAVRQAALSNTGSGGIYVTNRGNLTLAAASTNGDVVIRTANGANGSGSTAGNPGQGNPGQGGGTLTIDSVGGVSGVTTTGSGGITIVAGDGGTGAAGRDRVEISANGEFGGSGGNGGALVISKAINSAGLVYALAGSAGNGGKGGDADFGGDGGQGGQGGSAAINAAITATGAVSVATGNGGQAGDGGGFYLQRTLRGVGVGGGGGAGGALTSGAAGVINAGSYLSLQSGVGGLGGRGGFAYAARSGGSGGSGGAGGDIALSGTASAALSLQITAGAGGNGFLGGANLNGGGNGGNGGNGANGGAITVTAALVADDIILTGGNGGIGGLGDIGIISGIGGNGGSGGALIVSAALNATHDITLTAGNGGNGGEGSSGRTGIPSGPGGNGGNGSNGANGGRGLNGGAITLTAALNAGHNITLMAGNGGIGGQNGIGGFGGPGNLGGGSGGNGGNGGNSGASGHGADITINSAIGAGGDLTIHSGRGGNGQTARAGARGGNGASAGFVSGNGGTGGTGGVGGNGGSLHVNAALNATGNLTVSAGLAGAAGAAGAGGSPGFTSSGATLGSNGNPGIAGTAGSVGILAGSNVDLTAGVNLTLTGTLTPTSGDVALRAGMNAGNTLSLSQSSLNAGANNLALQGYNLSSPGTLNLAGSSVALKTGSGLGSAGSAVAVNATQLNLENTTSGDVYVTNTGAINLTGALNANNATLQTTNTGAGITQSAAGNITANSLSLTTNGGNTTLNNTGNNIAALGAVNLGTGALTLTNARAAGFSLGTISANGGIDVTNTAGGLSATGAITATGVALSADSIDISAAINATNTISLAPVTAGTSARIGGAAGPGFVIDSTELGFLSSASTLSFGKSVLGATTAGAMQLGALNVASGTLNLFSSGAITSTGALSVGGGTGTLNIAAVNGIGSAGAPLLTQVGSAALQNTAGGGIYLTNTGSLNLAASSVNGDVAIRTANGADAPGMFGAALVNGGAGGLGGSGGSINVTTVGGLSGVNTTGSGSLSLITGNGGNADGGSVFMGTTPPNAPLPAWGGNGGTGGAGGSITFNAPLSVAANGDLTLTTGSGGSANGGRGGDGAMQTTPGQPGFAGGNGGQGGTAGAGGSIMLNSGTLAARAIALGAGTGGSASGGAGGPGGTGGPAMPPTFPSAGPNGPAGVSGTAGTGGAAGSIGGSALDVTAATNLSVSGQVNASGNVSLKAGMNAGNTLTLAQSVVNAGANNIALQGYQLSIPGTLNLTGNTISIKTATGIGTSVVPILTTATNLALENTVSGGVYATNTGNVTVATASANGDIVLRTAAGDNGTALSPARAGGNLTVGTVGTLAGITATGSGNVTLAAGGGGNAFDDSGNFGNAGGAGGSITLNSTINAAQAASLSTGAGGKGGAATGTGGGALGGRGGSGGNGGSVFFNVPSAISAQSTSLSLGNGGVGGDTYVATGGFGGNGGSIVFNAQQNVTQSVAYTAGSGGAGGNNLQYSGGAGGSGGAITFNANFTAAQDAAFTAGNGGAGGTSLNPNVSAAAAGATGSINGSNIDISAGGNLGITGGIAASSGNVNLKAGFNGTQYNPGFTLSTGADINAGTGSATLAAFGLNNTVNVNAQGGITLDGKGGTVSNSGTLTSNNGTTGRITLQGNAVTPGGTLDAGGGTVQLISATNISGGAPGGTMTAGTLEVQAVSGIGSAGSALQTSVTNLALRNTGSGGIYATNTGDVTVAAASTNGDIDIRTTNGADNFAGSGTSGGNITVGTVGSLAGITTTGSGSITLTAGNGGNGTGSNGGSGGSGSDGRGGDGGSITLNAALMSAQATSLTAGNGGSGTGGNGNGNGYSGNGYGGTGGSITLNAALTSAQAVSLAAGSGGGGSRGTGSAGNGGISAGGAGGGITLNAALTSVQAASLTAGNGGSGNGYAGIGRAGNGGWIVLNSTLTSAQAASLTAGNGGSGSGNGDGFGGAGGQITLNAAVASAQTASLTAGNGGSGSGNGIRFGHGGGGGSIVLRAALTSAQAASLTAGNGGNGNGLDGTGGRGGSISLNAALTSAQAASFTAGNGGSSTNTNLSGSAGFFGGTAVDVSAGGDLSVSGAITYLTTGNVSLRAGMNAGNRLTLSSSLLNAGANNLTLQGYTISAPGALNLAGNTVSLKTGSGLGSAGNAVTVNATQLNLENATSGDVYVTNSGHINLTGAASNVSTAHLVSTGGDITLGAALNASGAGDAIRLRGTRFINNAGASALTAAAGRWIVWSDSPVNNGFGGLQSGSAAVWSSTYPGGAGATLVDTGNRFAFSTAPLTGVAVVKADDKSKVYGDTFTGFTFTASDGGGGATYGHAFTDAGGGAVNLTGGAPILASTGAAATATRLGGNGGGAAYDITVNVAGLSAAGYSSVIGSGGFLTITPRALTVSATGVNKTYDGNTSGTVTLTDNRVNSDVLTTAYTGAAFLDKNAAVGRALNVSGISLTGAAAVNYMLASTTAATTADIGQLGLSVSGITAANKVYDGTLAATVNTAAAAFAGLVSGDVVNITATGAFVDKNVNVGPAKTVNLTSSYSGADWLNYNITGQSTATANITARGLAIGATGVNRTYDGTTTGTVTLIDNRISGDVLTTSYGGAAFLDKHAGTGKALNVSGINLTGTDAGNYTFNTTAAATANIAQAALTLSAASQTRTYDGSTASSGTVGIAGLFGADTVTGATQRFDSANASAANGRTLLVNSGYAVNDGNGGGNYLVSTVNATGTINQAALTLTAAAQTRGYDGTTNSSAVVGVAGLFGTDTLTGATQRFDSANASAANSRTLLVNGGYTLSDGNGGGNYLVSTVSTPGTINQAPLTITANNATKTYGATLNFAGTEFASTGLITGETIGTVSLASTGAASGAMVANSPYAIAPSGGVAAAGSNFSLANYLVSYVNGNLTVNRAPLIVTANPLAKVGDNVPFAGGNGVSFLGLVNGETSASVLGGALAYSGTSQGAVNAGSYVISPGGLSLLSNNYTMSYADGTLTITASTGQIPGAQAAINTAQSGGGGSGGGTGGTGTGGGSGGGLFSGAGGDGPEMGLPEGVE